MPYSAFDQSRCISTSPVARLQQERSAFVAFGMLMAGLRLRPRTACDERLHPGAVAAIRADRELELGLRDCQELAKLAKLLDRRELVSLLAPHVF